MSDLKHCERCGWTSSSGRCGCSGNTAKSTAELIREAVAAERERVLDEVLATISGYYGWVANNNFGSQHSLLESLRAGIEQMKGGVKHE